jgi:hypothetical protein
MTAMPTHQFDTTAESKSRLTSVGQTPVVETATSVQAGLAHAARTLPAHTVAARLARSSGGHLARAGDALLQLQRLRGNGYVQQVVGHARQMAHHWAAPVIQTKLTLGPADDHYEREADRVSREVVRRTVQGRTTDEDGSARLSLRSGIHHSATSSAGGAISAEDQHAIQQARGRGQPLPSRVREPMEQAFGVDFRSVRIHADTQSERLAQSLQARAFTTGRDIFLRRGNQDLESRAGQELLAHELAHVVQQSHGNRAAAAALGGTQSTVGARSVHQGSAVVQRWPAITSGSGTFTYTLGREFAQKHVANNLATARKKARDLYDPWHNDPHRAAVTVIEWGSLQGVTMANDAPARHGYDWSLEINVTAVMMGPSGRVGGSGDPGQLDDNIQVVIVSGYSTGPTSGKITHVAASQ